MLVSEILSLLTAKAHQSCTNATICRYVPIGIHMYGSKGNYEKIMTKIVITRHIIFDGMKQQTLYKGYAYLITEEINVNSHAMYFQKYNKMARPMLSVSFNIH